MKTLHSHIHIEDGLTPKYVCLCSLHLVQYTFVNKRARIECVVLST